MLTILGLDQSVTCTGVVILDIMDSIHQGQEPHIDIEYWGAIKTERGQEDYIFDTMDRANQLVTELVKLIREYRPNVICFESLSLGSKGNATRTLPLLLGVILKGIDEAVWQYNVQIYHYAPKSLKKLATGNGNASKTMMFDQLQINAPELHKELAGKPKNIGRYDITDAYYLARYGYSIHKYKTNGK